MKIVFLLIVYFAGFATAVYCLAPAPQGQDIQSYEMGSAYSSALKSDEFAQSFKVALHRFVAIAKAAAGRAGRFIKQKLDERKMTADKTEFR